MLFDIRTAALDDHVEQRIRLAISLLAAYRMRARISPWDGTSCHLLIAAADDAYGRQTLSLAGRRGTQVLALGTTADDAGIPVVSPFNTASTFAKEIRDRLLQLVPSAGPVETTTTQPAICRLATPPLRGRAINARCNDRTLVLRPEVGRVYAATHSDLLAVADGLSGGDWEMEVDERPTSVKYQVSSSIESFLLRAACRASDRLPPFPEGRYHLDAWPDLGNLPALVGALQIAKLLVQGPMSVQELSQDRFHGIDLQELNAYLWAFAAADLLRESGARPAAPPPPSQNRLRPSLWSSIARRFGLLRS